MNASSTFMQMSNSILREAVTGIEVNNGGQLSLVGCIIENNYQGVVLNPYLGNHPAYFKATEFRTNATLLSPHQSLNRGKAGIVVKDVFFVEIGDFSLENNERNSFINLDYGVDVLRSNVDIISNYFQQNVYGVYANGDFVNFNTIYNVNIGHHEPGVQNEFLNNVFGSAFRNGTSSIILFNIYTNNFAACVFYMQPVGTQNRLSLNQFQNNDYGIRVNEVLQPQFIIDDNVFNDIVTNAPNKIAILFENVVQPSPSWIPTMPPSGWPGSISIDDNLIKDYEIGIELVNVSMPYIANNRISRVPANWNLPTYGIRLFNCPNAQVERNQVAGLSSSIWASHGIATDFAVNNLLLANCVKDLGRGIWVGGQSIGVKIRSNTMENCNTAFFANWAYIGTQGWWDENGTVLQPSDNVWNGSFTNHLYNFYPVSNTNAFILRSPGSSDFKIGHMPNPFISEKPLNATNYNPISVAISAPVQYPFYFGNSVCDGGWSLSTPPGNNLVLEAEEIAMIADTSSLNVWNPDDVAQAWLRDQTLYRTLIQDTVTYTNSSVLNLFLGNTQQTEIDEIENIDELIRIGLESGLLQDIATAKALNNVLAGSEMPVQTTASFNTIYVNELEEQDGAYDLAAAELSTLRVIAQQCPYIYGTSVYQARALLSLTDTAFVQYVTPCELGYLNGTAKTGGLPVDAEVNPVKQILVNELKLFPNTASEYVTVMFVSDDIELGVFKIIDAIGRTIHVQSIRANENTRVSLAELKNGIFYCYIINGNQEIICREKLVVSK